MAYTLIEDDEPQGGYKLMDAPEPLDMNPVTAFAANAANSLLFGFGDELYGKLMPGNYADNRDRMRASLDKFRKEHPIAAVAGDLSGALVPGLGAARLLGLARMAGPTSTLGKAGVAALTGGVSGAIGGAGNAKEMPDVPVEMAKGAAIGAPLAGVSSLGMSGASAVMNNAVKPRVAPRTADDIARRRIAEAVGRDTRGMSEMPLTPEMMSDRMRKLGNEAMVVDAGGQNVKQLLDTVSTMPGKTVNRVKNAIHNRQASRAGRLISAADNAMGTSGTRLNHTIESLDEARKTAAAPLYQQLHTMDIPVTASLQSKVDAAMKLGAGHEAQKIATASEVPFTLDPTGRTMLMRDLDYLKQGLDKLIQKESPGGEISSVGRSYVSLRDGLIKQLDFATTNPKTKESLYKSARDAYAGPSQMIDAATKGSQSISNDAWRIDNITKGMSASELDAFRVGAMESLRKKLGTRGGQTQLLNMWSEPATRDKLKAIFPDLKSYREFASRVFAENHLKGLESVSNGSATATRHAAQDDLIGATAKDMVELGNSVTTGKGLGMLNAMKSLYGRAAVPQSVRDSIGQQLMSRDPRTLEQIRAVMDMQQVRGSQNAANAGISGGLLGSMLSPF